MKELRDMNERYGFSAVAPRSEEHKAIDDLNEAVRELQERELWREWCEKYPAVGARSPERFKEWVASKKQMEALVEEPRYTVEDLREEWTFKYPVPKSEDESDTVRKFLDWLEEQAK